ncbi:MAG: hypothetical protein AABY22_14860 [Nanoarchaeota archaeon]
MKINKKQFPIEVYRDCPCCNLILRGVYITPNKLIKNLKKQEFKLKSKSEKINMGDIINQLKYRDPHKHLSKDDLIKIWYDLPSGISL